jgi:hypothetical protein
MTILSSQTGADYRPATAAAVQALADSGIPLHLPGTEAYAARTGTSDGTQTARVIKAGQPTALTSSNTTAVR